MLIMFEFSEWVTNKWDSCCYWREIIKSFNFLELIPAKYEILNHFFFFKWIITGPTDKRKVFKILFSLNKFAMLCSWLMRTTSLYKQTKFNSIFCMANCIRKLKEKEVLLLDSCYRSGHQNGKTKTRWM